MSQVVIANGIVYPSGQIPDTAHAPIDEWVTQGEASTRACVTALLMMPGLDVEVAVTALA
jgi:enamine deaminase RidA (YjgF/YER057c/UK114 family)